MQKAKRKLLPLRKNVTSTHSLCVCVQWVRERKCVRAVNFGYFKFSCALSLSISLFLVFTRLYSLFYSHFSFLSVQWCCLSHSLWFYIKLWAKYDFCFFHSISRFWLSFFWVNWGIVKREKSSVATVAAAVSSSNICINSFFVSSYCFRTGTYLLHLIVLRYTSCVYHLNVFPFVCLGQAKPKNAAEVEIKYTDAHKTVVENH